MGLFLGKSKNNYITITKILDRFSCKRNEIWNFTIVQQDFGYKTII